jgi:GH25 family lysozyme M1 (1,4-beta-N-acetylmuramidase)
MARQSVQIIDLYSGNNFDAAQIVAQGYGGVIFKAGQGGWADVPRYRGDWWRQAGQYGLLRGWYWLADSRYSAGYHLDEIRRWFPDPLALNSELGFWVDIEKPRVSMTEADYRKTKYHGHRNVLELIAGLEAMGVRPGVYTGPGAYGLVFENASFPAHNAAAFRADGTQRDLWTAQYPWIYLPGVSRPSLYGSFKKWTFWQWREGPDVNIYNGTQDEFAAAYGEPPLPPLPPDPPAGKRWRITIPGAGQYVNIRDRGGLPLGADIGDFHNGQTGTATERMSGANWECYNITDGATPPGWIFTVYNGGNTNARAEEIT